MPKPTRPGSLKATQVCPPGVGVLTTTSEIENMGGVLFVFMPKEPTVTTYTAEVGTMLTGENNRRPVYGYVVPATRQVTYPLRRVRLQ